MDSTLVLIKLKVSLVKRAKVLAAQRDTTLRAVVNDALANYLVNVEKEKSRR